LKLLKDNGFDGIKESGGNVRVWNTTKLKSKSQLTDIWNKANKAGDLTSSIKSAKQSGQSFDEWVKGQETKTGLFNEYTPDKRLGGSVAENTPLTKLGYKPDADITVYRGVPKGVKNINDGDWVTTVKQLAKDYAGTGDVISQKVKARNLFAEQGDDTLEELVYSSKPVKARSQLKAEWDKVK
jgi:hypothetical protein